MKSLTSLAIATVGTLALSAGVSAGELPPLIKFGQQPAPGVEEYSMEDPPEDTNIPTLVLAHQQPILTAPGLTLWTYKMYGLREVHGKVLRISFLQNPDRVGFLEPKVVNQQVVKISAADLQNMKYRESLCEKEQLTNDIYSFEKRIPANSNTMLISVIASTDDDGRRKKVFVDCGDEKTREYFLVGPHLPGQEPRLNQRIRTE